MTAQVSYHFALYSFYTNFNYFGVSHDKVSKIFQTNLTYNYAKKEEEEGKTNLVSNCLKVI